MRGSVCDKSWRSQTALCLLLAAAFAGCQEAMEPGALQLLQAGYEQCHAGDYTAARQDMDLFLRDFPATARCDEARYLRGLARYELGDFDGAKADFQKAADSPMTAVSALAAKALGDLAYDLNELALAQHAYRKAIGDLTDERARTEAHFGLGRTLQRLSQWTEADVHFQRVMFLSPQSDVARLAERRVNCRAWAVQAGLFQRRPAADALAERLRADRLPADVVPDRFASRPSYVVQVGNYDHYGRAAEALTLVRKHQPDAFIVPTPAP